MEVKLVSVDKIIPYARNPRINDHAVDAVAASIKEFGFRVPIVCDEGMVVIVGHTRLKAAKKLGMEAVPVHVVTGLTDAQKKAYRIADNKTGEIAEWDENLLRTEFEDLKLASFDLEVLAFSDLELEKLFQRDNLMHEPKEYDESIADGIEFNECPKCAYKWPK